MTTDYSPAVHQVDHARFRLERPDEASVRYDDVTVVMDSLGALGIAGQPNGEAELISIAWHAPGYWSAVIFLDEDGLPFGEITVDK